MRTQAKAQLEITQIPVRQCEGWHEPSHPTQGPVVVLIGPDGEALTLCLCCGVDFQHDYMTSDDDKEVAGLALDVARVFCLPLR